MAFEKKINQDDYRRASSLLAILFESGSDIENVINTHLQKYGIVYFFEHLEDFELDTDTIIKLQAIRAVLFGLEISNVGSVGGGD